LKRPRLSSAPIFVQVLALVLFSLVAAQLINLAVILCLPDPPPLGYSIPEAARALRGEEVVTPQGQRLRAHVRAAPPPEGPAVGAVVGGPVREHLAHHHHDPMGAFLRGLLARELDVPEDRVRVQVSPLGSRLRHTVRMVETRRSRHAGHGGAETETAEDRFFIAVGPGPGVPDIPRPALGRVQGAARAMVFPPFTAALQRADGQWLVLEPTRPWLSPWQLRTLIWFGLSALLLTPLAWLIARRLARPIHSFAEAAERLGADPNAPPLDVAGPAEVRTATAAFNDMQEKLRSYVAERTAMVAAIAHDLRTPLTRMRFRIENAPDEVREKVVADIEQMDAMVSQALTFVRGDTGNRERVKLDLADLVRSVVEDVVEMGADAGFEGERLVIEGDPVALRRLFTNLVENAVKFGGRARVRLERDGGAAVVQVEDDGPGLPATDLERAFEPFHRGDASRAQATGGFGLGLAVARSVARAHGGEVTLANRSGGGLAANVRLPL